MDMQKIDYTTLLDALVEAVTNKDTTRILSIMTTPEYRAQPIDSEDRSIEPYDEGALKYWERELDAFFALFDKDGSLEIIGATCAKDFCQNSDINRLMCFYGRYSDSVFPAKIGFHESRGFFFDTCNSIIMPEELKNIKKVILKDSWKLVSSSLTENGQYFIDMFD